MGQLCILWVSFIFFLFKNFHYLFFRNPTPREFEGNLWQEANSFPLDFFVIGNEMNEQKLNLISTRKDLYSERANFWSRIKAHYPREDDDDVHLATSTKKTLKGEL